MSNALPVNPLSPRHNRGLELIALYKFIKAIILLIIGIGLMFVTQHDGWLAAVIAWADEELMLPHSKVALFLMEKFTQFVHGDNLVTTGVLALVYAVVLMVESIGVYMEQRWAEVLMVVASAGLIPFEIYHMWHKPSVTKVVIILCNIALVWYLYRILKKKRAAAA